MRKGTTRENIIQDNPIYTKFVVIDDPSGLFNPGAIFPATQILGTDRWDKPVSQDELPEGLVMLYKRYGEVIYRCKFTNGKLKVIAKN